MRIFSLSLLFVVAFSAGMLHGCGGSPAAKATPRCVLASDCKGALVCALGFCVSACEQSKDCSGGQLCVKSDMGNACRAPETTAKGCAQNSDCKKLCADTATVCPVVCGRDLQCRTQCIEDVDCLRGQKCTVGGSCADLILDKAIYDPATNDFIVPTTGGAGSTGTAGTTGAAGDTGGAGTTGTAGATGSAGMTGAAGGTPDGGAGTTGAAGTSADAGNPEVPLAVDGMMVMPNAQMRQGQSGLAGVTITITKAAGGLSNASIADAPGLVAKVDAASTDTSLVIKVSVPHATPLGKVTLKVSTKGGVVTLTDVVEITAITAGPAGMDTNVGSAASPYRSLKQAIGVADVGDTIHLLDGKYTIAASAETWGYVVPDNLTIVGDSLANTIIDGVGAATSPDGFDVSMGLTLKTLTLQHFRYGIDMQMPASKLTIEDVYVGGNASHGIYVEAAAMGATVTISGKNTLIDQPGQTALYVYNVPNVTVNITDGTLQGGNEVVTLYYNCSGCKLTATGTTFKQLSTSYGAINIPVSNNAMGTTVSLTNATIIGNVSSTDAKGTMTITGGTITQKNGNGIDYAGLVLNMTGTSLTMVANNEAIAFTGPQASLSLKNVTITGGSTGVHQSGVGSTAKLRGTTIKTPYYYAYYLQAGDLDLGTAAESGDNVIDAAVYTGYYTLTIARATGAAAGNPVTCSGTAIGAAGGVPVAQTVDASGGAVVKEPKLWSVSVGNKLIFF
jgi:Protein of unknown function (DUF1565)